GVPEIFFADVPLKVIILEDLGDATMESMIRSVPEERPEYYKKAIDLLVEMQVFTASSGAGDCVAYGRKFDFDLLMWEFEHFHQYCLLELGKRRPSTAEEEMLSAVYREISLTLSNLPYIFTHRDFQSRNLMVKGKGLRLIDFQDALLAPIPYDLTALLRDSYVKLPAGEIEFLISYYIEKRKARFDDGFTAGEFRRWFHLQTIQRKLKDAGRFVYIDRVKKNPKFLPNIPVSLGYAAGAMKALGSYGEFMGLIASLLGDYIDV
ncbi:MAG: phosphotransferase, partial [Deltaproteobacteria bacterium]|nr:phosphotransferase [Deltaproteobacteria bacterium]